MSSRLRLEKSIGHLLTLCVIYQPLGSVSETLRDEKYFLVTMVK